MALPRNILDRAERVYGYHRSTKYLSSPAHKPPDFASLRRPAWVDRLPTLPRTPLPTILLDAPGATLPLMESSLEALPESFVAPPQTLKTLASWLYFADGVRHQRRTVPSHGLTHPTEIYVAAFSVEGLEPGLYHYDPREFALRKLRDGVETLAQLKRGRPDLEFLKRAPAALLVSTVFSRATWHFGPRGYRTALLDAGHLTQNLITAASGLGIQTLVRLRMTDSSMRELIGLPVGAPFEDAEAVQSMVVWADRVQRQVELQRARRGPQADAEADDAPPAPGGEDRLSAAPPVERVAFNAGASAVSSVLTPELVLPSVRRGVMSPIARAPQRANLAAYDAVTSVHVDCTAAGMAVREIRPPLTEISPVPPDMRVSTLPAAGEMAGGLAIRNALVDRPTPAALTQDTIRREVLQRIARISLAGGTYFPLFPDGPQAALVRPLWLINGVNGFDAGIWYYHANDDAWSKLRGGSFRFESRYLTMDDERFANAAAVCVLVAGMPTILGLGGPDTYRLAHLEAGIIAQRMHLSAAALDCAAASTATFYDDEVRKFLGLAATGWEPLNLIAIGVPA